MRFFFKSLKILGALLCVAGSAGLVRSSEALIRYSNVLTLGPEMEWRFYPLVVDLDKDGHLDLVATARLATPALHVWRGGGEGNFSPAKSTWSEGSYAALASGDINGDGFPDIVAAGHFGGVQTLLSDGKGGFTETVVQNDDGYVGAQLADLNDDGHVDLILLGYEKGGIEIYFGDGTGKWKFQSRLPEVLPGPSVPGRALVVGDLNHDGHPDIVAAFQRWGLYIYYGDERGHFAGGLVDLHSNITEFQSLALVDVNHDGRPDIALNGTFFGSDKPNGPEVYLADSRGGFKNGSNGLKVLKSGAAGIALGDLDGDGNLDLIAAGNIGGDIRDGYGLFCFKGDGKGNWTMAEESGLPTRGLPAVHSITLADLYGDGTLDIIVLTGPNGSINVWRRR
jgi:hypothetical protein